VVRVDGLLYLNKEEQSEEPLLPRKSRRAYIPPLLQTRLRAPDYEAFVAIAAERDMSEYALMQFVLLDFVRAEQATKQSI
jgi:hypothetical protein